MPVKRRGAGSISGEQGESGKHSEKICAAIRVDMNLENPMQPGCCRAAGWGFEDQREGVARIEVAMPVSSGEPAGMTFDRLAQRFGVKKSCEKTMHVEKNSGGTFQWESFQTAVKVAASELFNWRETFDLNGHNTYGFSLENVNAWIVWDHKESLNLEIRPLEDGASGTELKPLSFRERSKLVPAVHAPRKHRRKLSIYNYFQLWTFLIDFHWWPGHSALSPSAA
ncbi:hypothetical protein B0H17DRAFT_1141735 [Mycena rosella]|uniref:Uncharacterized protein n=1 Tax=Mycena rosella TaxID=1033263 RepID=A0AAD7CYV1_MYCRO|nr:hypothetical protein B0H17DRAFT_1141735 [Mycena rosella]